VRRWLPSPLLSAALWATWLLLNDSLAPAHVLFGLLAGWLLPLLVAPLNPPGPRLRRPALLARLVLRVGGDVVLSALEVARGIVRPHRRPPRGAFVVVPLDLRDAHGLAALAIITTVVPGTLWSELAADHTALLLHVFDLQDEAAFIAGYKSRYELPLQEIFE
jgi:multicomponent K+:H+ antiporter subunit E